MFPYTFEIVTAITIATISVILTLYFVVLKRMGWLREAPSESAFLCSNPKCKKMFQKPMTLTDLSEKPPRKLSACPHCGSILTASPPITQKPLSREKPKLTIKELLSMTKKQGITATTPGNNPGPPHHEYKALEHLKAAKPLSETSKEQPASVLGCSHYFGYLQTIPKNDPLPEDCFGCSKMVDCFLRRVEQ